MAQSPLTEVCPHFHAAIELIGKRWSGAIIWALADQPMRFAELRRAVPGLSDRLLSRRLRELETAGLISQMAKVVKVIKTGDISRAVKLNGIGATAAAKTAIEAAGGSVA